MSNTAKINTHLNTPTMSSKKKKESKPNAAPTTAHTHTQDDPILETQESTNTPHIHQEHLNKFSTFIRNKSVPNILVYGPIGSGKKYLVNQFMQRLYDNDPKSVQSNILYVDCVNGKGINFIRDELKMFAKTNVNPLYFKSIILLLIDKLTIDAQSALRRCIELYNHNTRFFAIVNNKSTIIKPLLSRFCEMRISLPLIQGNPTNLHKYFRPKSTIVDQNLMDAANEIERICQPILQYIINPSEMSSDTTSKSSDVALCISCANQMYSLGILATDLVEYLNANSERLQLNEYENSIILTYYMKCRKHIRSEQFLLFSILYLGIIRRTAMIENIDLL